MKICTYFLASFPINLKYCTDLLSTLLTKLLNFQRNHFVRRKVGKLGFSHIGIQTSFLTATATVRDVKKLCIRLSLHLMQQSL